MYAAEKRFGLSPFVMVDGYLFFHRRSATLDEIIEKVRGHDSPERAQYWMNFVLLEGFVSAVCDDDWESSDPTARSILVTVSDA
jgi:hypothetical protein